MQVSTKYEEFLQTLEHRLRVAGYAVRRTLWLYSNRLDIFGIKTSLEGTKFGLMNRFVFVNRMESADINSVSDFSSQMTKYALTHSPAFLPRGFGSATLCVPVIVSEDFSDDVKQWVTKTLPKKHWAAFEFPVLLSLKNSELYYCRRTPIWGCAYYHGFRKFVEKMLRF